jgi:hypothetical protein
MREIFTSGSAEGAPGNRCFYLEMTVVRRTMNHTGLKNARRLGSGNFSSELFHHLAEYDQLLHVLRPFPQR